MRVVSLALCWAAVGLASPASAREDGQAWGAVTATGSVRGDLFVWLEAQARATHDFGGGGQLILRPAIGARIAQDAHAVAGYAFVRTDPENGATVREHRPWQQVQFVPVRNRGGAPLLISRTRLEQRMIEGRGDTGWRLRQLVRAQVPVARGSLVQIVGYGEGFLNLNKTAWGARRGVDQWRGFVGVGLPVARRVRLEPGYLHQRVFRPGENRANHVLNASLVVGL